MSDSLWPHGLYVAHQAPQSTGFSRQEYWSGLSFPSSEDLPKPGIKLTYLMSPSLAGRFFTTNTTWEASLGGEISKFSWPKRGFPDGSMVKNLPANAGDNGFDPWVRKISWRRKWQLQYSCLGNPMDREAWWTAVHGVTKELDIT